MQINRIEIKQLFGMFNHDIRLKVNDRITIIHGPNGVGKTTVLKVIQDIFSRRFYAIQSVPFKQITITFDDNQKLDVIKESNNNITLRLRKNNSIIEKGTLGKISTDDIEKHIPVHAIDDIIPQLDRVGERLWYDRSTNESITLEEVLFRYQELLPFAGKPLKSIPESINKLLMGHKTYFIQTQRLFIFSSEDRYRRQGRKISTTNTVEKYSSEMADMLQEKLKESGSVAASLDRTFPHRLLQSKSPKGATEKNIRDKYHLQSNYRERLMKAGLIEEGEQVSLPTSNISVNDLKVLWYYLDDIDNKMIVFDPLLKKVELFKDIINSRFLYKSFSIDKSEGFVFKSENGEPVPSKALSSGEQHELVLAYELLFKVPEKSFIMIDEPELSLHVTWQHKFLNDLERISKLTDLDFLIATHSPSIIHNRRSLMVALPESANA